MAAIEKLTQPVFLAKTSGRRYLTLRSAADAEARAMLKRKYPTERPEYENGQCYFPGYHWSSDERLVKVHARLSRMILKSFRLATQAAPAAASTKESA